MQPLLSRYSLSFRDLKVFVGDLDSSLAIVSIPVRPQTRPFARGALHGAARTLLRTPEGSMSMIATPTTPICIIFVSKVLNSVCVDSYSRNLLPERRARPTMLPRYVGERVTEELYSRPYFEVGDGVALEFPPIGSLYDRKQDQRKYGVDVCETVWA